MGLMVRLFGAGVFFAVLAAHPAFPQEPRQTLGMARLFTNDTIADRQDRWRTGGYGVSAFRGESWSGALPARPFEIMEYRIRGEVMAPNNLGRPGRTDRLYAGTLWLGAHTHFGWRGVEVTSGADLVVTGEQTGIRRLQSSIHDRLSMPRMKVENHQVANGVYLHGTTELARSVVLGWGKIRPFVEMQLGVETLARVGVDLTFGGLGQGGLRMRDPITGQRIAGIVGTDPGGWSFLVGGDVARVARSVFLPESRGYRATATRHRLRAGVNYGFGASNLFYGVTYLSPEFTAQPEGQFVGSLSLVVRF